MTSTNSKHTEWILETIDHLRRRKARPDVERICHVVRRRYGMSAAETEAKLEKLVDAEIVIKVDYKGNTSYRNAAKWRKSMLGCAVLNSTSISVKVLEAILALSKSAPSNIGKEAEDSNTSAARNASVDDGSKFAENDLSDGVTLESIGSWLQQHCEDFAELKSPLTLVLKREVDAGRIKRVANTNYVITPEQMQEISDGIIQPLKSNRKTENKPMPANQPVTCKTPSNINNNDSNVNSKSNIMAPNSITSYKNGKSVDSTIQEAEDNTDKVVSGQSADINQNIQQTSVQPSRRGRPPKNRPAPGTVPTQGHSVDKSSESSSKLKRMLTSPESVTGPPDPKVAKRSSSQAESECDYCGRTSFSNRQGEHETLLSCKDCTTRAHPSCLKYSSLLASRAFKRPWQCMNCKTCCVCHDTKDSTVMLVCDGCDKGYHTDCHQPTVTKKPSGSWECSGCQMESALSQRNDFMPQYGIRQHCPTGSAPPTPSESPVSMMNGHPPLSTLPVFSMNGVYPDASEWSVDDVVKYITSAGFSKEAEVFREQEIDGVALLLLKRTDVLQGLDLKLGPALKINRHIQGLQAARDTLLN